MPVRAAAVGTKYASSEVEVTARTLLAYAAALGETSDIVFDDAREGGIVGFPPFCVSLEWRVTGIREAGNPFGVTYEEAARAVHAIQDSIFFQPIRPGARLITESLVVEVRPTRAGALTRTKLETRDAANGQPVVTSWCGMIYRGVGVEGEARVLESPPPLAEGEADPSRCESVVLPIKREAAHVYTECADIWNPIHTERQVALAVGLPDIILHGTATWALAAREIIRRRAGGEPCRLRRLHGRFTGMVIPGTAVTVCLGAEENGIVFFQVCNAAGQPALSQGVAVLGPS